MSVLHLAQDERSVLSGSWDKRVLDWDLNTGQVIRTFDGSGGQISALEMRPFSSLPVPEQMEEAKSASNTFSGNISSKPPSNLHDTNGLFATDSMETLDMSGPVPDLGGSPTGSLFGENDHDSLFGDDDNNPSAAPPTFGDDDDDDFSRAIANGFKQPEGVEGEGDVHMMDMDQGEDPFSDSKGAADNDLFGTSILDDKDGIEPSASLSNGLPHAEDMELDPDKGEADATNDTSQAPVEGTIFLAASIDGSLRIWDKRKPTTVAKMLPKNVPPWCMGACWSPDGNFIYAGRRNGTVEEFSLHKGVRSAERTFRFPNGSGPVSSVRAMPNGRHLIW